MKNIKKFICLLIMTVLITPSIAIAEDTYSGYFNNEEITMFADTSVKISENEKSAVEDMITDEGMIIKKGKKTFHRVVTK